MNSMAKMTILFLISQLITACGTDDIKSLDETVETWVLKDEGRKENANSIPQKIEGVCPSKIKFNIEYEEAILDEPNGSIQNLKWTLYSPPPHATTNIYIYKGYFAGEDADKENYIAVENIEMLDYSEWTKRKNYLEFYFKDRNAQCAYKQIGKDNIDFP